MRPGRGRSDHRRTHHQGNLYADAVLVAAGPWSGEVSDRLGAAIPIRPRRGMLLVTAPMPQRIFHKVYDGDYVGPPSPATPTCRPRAWWRAPRAAPC